MIPRNRRIIDLKAIEQNMRLLRSAVPPTAKMMAVVKADGYGHGAVETARAAIRGGADMLAVASAGEGRQHLQFAPAGRESGRHRFLRKRRITGLIPYGHIATAGRNDRDRNQE